MPVLRDSKGLVQGPATKAPEQRKASKQTSSKGLPPPVDEVLKAAKATNFSDEESRRTFLEKYMDRVGGPCDTDPSSPLVLKKGKKNSKKGKRLDGEVFFVLAQDPAEFEEHKEFVQWAFNRNFSLLEHSKSYKDTPLLQAIEKHNHGFVELVLKYAQRPEYMARLRKILGMADTRDRNCLHQAIRSESPFTESIIWILRQGSMGTSKTNENMGDDSESGSESEEEMTKSKLEGLHDNIFARKILKGWTPLHFAVGPVSTKQAKIPNEKYRYLFKHEEDHDAKNPSLLGKQLHSDSAITETASVKQYESPNVKNFEEAKGYEADDRVTRKEQIHEPTQASAHDESNTDSIGKPPRLVENKDAHEVQTVEDGGTTHPEWRDYCQSTVVRSLIEANPSALIIKDRNHRTPFQLRLQLLRRQQKKEEKKKQEEEKKRQEEEKRRQEGGSQDEKTAKQEAQQWHGDGGAEENEEVALEEGAEDSDESDMFDPSDGEDEDAGDEGAKEEDEKGNDHSNSDLFKDTSNPEYDHKHITDHEKEVQLTNNDGVLQHIRDYVIDIFDRRAANAALYQVGHERTIEFNLSGLPYKSIGKDFFDRLGNVLHFEGRLKFVALPQLNVEDGANEANGNVALDSATQQQPESRGSGNSVQKARGLQPIFEWLKDLHVESVMKVAVIDDAELPHSDAAIEACMKNFVGVRVWNWRRVDLCIDVIACSAPSVTDVTLYSSGNNAVLVGWSSSEGLPKLQELRKVRIMVREGLETQKTFRKYRKTFETNLKKRTPNVVEVFWQIDVPSQDLPLLAASSTEKAPKEPKWMRTMSKFAEFLRSTIDSNQVSAAPPVKIAIIDDGIDSTLEIFQHRIQTGESFYKGGSGRWQGAYYVPTGNHGTLMAQLICEICPVAKLYIAQLEPVIRSDGRCGFSPQSATDAINWAVSRGVDIISMSWSIDWGQSDITELQDALEKANEKRIVMFCSSIDEGPVADDHTYPGKSKKCIKIGAAAGNGSRLSWASPMKSDYFLPGDESVQVRSQKTRQNGSGTRRAGYWSEVPRGGSSLATALAAGLAGVLIYCDRLAHPELASSQLSAGLSYFRGKDMDSMRHAFNVMARGTVQSDGNNFLRVWEHVPLHLDFFAKAGSVDKKSAKRELKWNPKKLPRDTEETRKVLEEFVDSLKEKANKS